jgi:hypothetical protein
MQGSVQTSTRLRGGIRVVFEIGLAAAGGFIIFEIFEHLAESVMIAAIAAIVVLSIVYPIALAVIFISLVTLMPKLPLIPIRGYMVPVRIEDIFLAFALAVVVFRALISHAKVARHVLAGPMLAFFAAEGWSLVFALALLGTISNHLVATLFWLRTLEYFLASVLASLAVRSWRDFRLVLSAFILCVLLVGIYGILQEFSLVPAFNAMHQDNEIVTVSYMPGFGSDRLLSTFGGPYDLAAFYLIAVPVLAALQLSARSKVTRVNLSAVLFLSLCCLYLTFARAPLVSMAVSLSLAVWLMGRRKLSLILGSLIPLPAALIAGFSARLKEFLESPTESASAYARLWGEWPSAIHGFLRSPLFGTGPSSVGSGMGVDCLYLLLLGTTGVLGLIVFLWLVRRTFRFELWLSSRSGNWMLKALGTGLAAGTVGLLINGVTQDTFFLSKVAFTYWFLFGLLLAGARLEHADFVRRSRSRNGNETARGSLVRAVSGSRHFGSGGGVWEEGSGVDT